MQKYKPTEKTFYFHDYETFGADPSTSKPSQFAGIRTDYDLNILPDDKNDKLNIYCRFSEDYLPSPEACFITGITPQTIKLIDDEEYENEIKGKSKSVYNEDQFSKIILSVMKKDNTCSIGYNSINFDDEVTRNILFRNFRNPYTREWQNGCSRADGIEIVRLAHAIDPKIMIFPNKLDADGNIILDRKGNPTVSFKLEELSKANGIVHENAHDALSDVYALIGVLKIIKEKRPDIFEFCLEKRNKKNNTSFIKEAALKRKVIFHTSSYYKRENWDMAILLPIETKFSEPNTFSAIKLSSVNKESLEMLITLSPEEIRKILFMKTNDLLENGLLRPPITKIKINQFQMFGDLSELTKYNLPENVIFDGNEIRENKKFIIDNMDIIKEKLQILENISNQEMNIKKEIDVDESIYNGFLDQDEYKIMDDMHYQISKKTFDENINKYVFKTPKLNELFIRFIGRNYHYMLDIEKGIQWDNFVKNRITGKLPNSNIEYNVYQYIDKMQELSITELDERKRKIFYDLLQYGIYITNKFKLFDENSKLLNIRFSYFGK